MKLSKISAAIGATAVAATAQAQVGALDAVATNYSGGALQGVSAIALVVSDRTAAGLRAQQGIDAVCNSSPASVLCAPSISSSELRAILANDTAQSSLTFDGAAGSLTAAGGFTGKNTTWREYAGTGISDALSSFLGSGVVNGFSCGQGKPVSLFDAATGGDAATITAVEANSTANPQIGMIHATSLVGTQLSFVKLDGVPPSELDLLSSNYNLVSNLHGASAPAVASGDTHGITVNIVTAGLGAGVAAHIPAACSPLTTGTEIAEIDGGAE